MKKLLSILVLSLLFGGTSYAEILKYECKYIKGGWPGNLEYINYQIDLKNKQAASQWVYEGKFDQDTYTIKSIDDEKVFLKNNNKKFPKDAWFFYYATDQRVVNGKIINYYDCKYDNELLQAQISNNKEQLQKTQKDRIMFTIKDKREQCEVIGFKPETEKFADCVLRLVELDVKQQQDQKIAAAQNAGNMEIANQLQKMRNASNGQYLMDLANQLTKPQQFNSNIYFPETQRCVLQGFDSFAKMTCR